MKKTPNNTPKIPRKTAAEFTDAVAARMEVMKKNTIKKAVKPSVIFQIKPGVVFQSPPVVN